MKPGKRMHRIARGALILATCALLMGFPKVSKVNGSVSARTGNFLTGLFARPKQLAVGDSPTPYFMVKVAAGASVTLRENDCELTFARSFLMPRTLHVCDRKKERRDDQDKQQQQDQQQQDQGSSSEQQSASSQSRASSTTQSPASTTTASTTTSSTTASTTVAAGSAGGLTTLQTTLIAIGGAAAAQKAYVEIKDKDDEPVSK